MHTLRTTKLAVTWGAPLMALMLSAGCKDKAETPTDPVPAATAPMRTITATPALIAKGKTAFGACAGCHGAAGEGRVGIGPRLVSESFLQAASDEFLFHTIKTGRAGTTMIPWGNSYDDATINGVIAYIRSMKETTAATLDEGALKGTPAKGEETFRSVCAACHGRSGGGYQETSNGTGIGRKVFLDAASNGFLRHIIKEGKTHTAMRGFAKDDPMAVANLDDPQIENLISYLRKNAW